MKYAIIIAVFFFNVQNSNAILTPIVDSIPMQDGKKLAADIYIPSGMSSGPVIVIQTPYNRQISRVAGLPMGIGQNINASNYIFVITDWRGFYGSAQAAYIGSPDRGRDGYSTIEWVASQTWSNGKTGTWGPSALGKVQFQTAKTKPPHLTCINPSVAAPQFEYNEYFPNGSLRTEYVEQLDGLGFGLTPFLMAHPYKDNAWNLTESINTYYDSISVPCFMIGGWYDHNTQLMMDCFEQLRSKSLFTVRSKHKILMGPWVHGGHGAARVGSSAQGELSYPNAENTNDTFALKFFDFYLRNIGNSWDATPVYSYYQMGDNVWKASPDWPPSGLNQVKFYLYADGSLRNTFPSDTDDSLQFVYDPLDPSPTTGGSTLRSDLTQGPLDQRAKVESRSDILIFSSSVFTQDVVLKGNVKVHLKVASDRPDTDFDIRFCDVYPDGRSMLINDGVLRMRFRNGFTFAQTSMMTPGSVYDCIIELPATCITFKSGHKFRILVSSSNYPRFNRNMNNGSDMYPGKSTDSVLNGIIAHNTVYTNSVQSSYVELPLLNYISDIRSVQKGENTMYYPNPGNAIVRIELPESFRPGTALEIYNEAGVRVYKENVNEHILKLDVSEFSNGTYILRFESNGRLIHQKFIVHR